MTRIEEVDPWLVCSDVEFERFVTLLRRDDSTLRQQAEKDGVDIEDVIFALRVKRSVMKMPAGETRH